MPRLAIRHHVTLTNQMLAYDSITIQIDVIGVVLKNEEGVADMGLPDTGYGWSTGTSE